MAEYEQFQDRDYSGDQITPQFIHEQLRAHDKKMRDNRNQWALTKACYTTNYWKHVRHGQAASNSRQRDQRRGKPTLRNHYGVPVFTLPEGTESDCDARSKRNW